MNAEIREPLQRKLSFPFAKRHGVLVRGIANDLADTVCRPGVTPQALAEVRRFIGVPLKLERVSSETFDSMLRIAYEAGSGAAMQMLEGLDDNTDLAHLAEDIPESSDLLESDDEAPIIRLINALLTQAVKENASDIHIEPYENRLVIRFRVDGVLREVLQTKRAVAPLVVSRIKVMSKLDIAERRLPQDGRISLRIAGRAVDVRVSTLPSGHGERVVLRLLDKQAGRIELTSLGMDPPTQETMDEIIHKPHGIILVTGPTGSGKTTTLYAALERINDNTRNVMTVEDPIEYYIDGIGQTQVNTKVEMTFARGLRAILRQDPDVVMVGEIRDIETAQIAVQASLTGHLVLSTLHTNTAVGAITRLRVRRRHGAARAPAASRPAAAAAHGDRGGRDRAAAQGIALRLRLSPRTLRRRPGSHHAPARDARALGTPARGSPARRVAADREAAHAGDRRGRTGTRHGRTQPRRRARGVPAGVPRDLPRHGRRRRAVRGARWRARAPRRLHRE